MVDFLLSVLLGSGIYYIMSEGRNKQKSERKASKTKNFLGKLIPSLKLYVKGYEIHIHHWQYLLAIFLALTLFFRGILSSYPIVAGFLLGGIVEGLMYKDRFQMFKKRSA